MSNRNGLQPVKNRYFYVFEKEILILNKTF